MQLDQYMLPRIADIGLSKFLAGMDVKASSATFFWAAPEQLQVTCPAGIAAYKWRY